VQGAVGISCPPHHPPAPTSLSANRPAYMLSESIRHQGGTRPGGSSASRLFEVAARGGLAVVRLSGGEPPLQALRAARSSGARELGCRVDDDDLRTGLPRHAEGRAGVALPRRDGDQREGSPTRKLSAAAGPTAVERACAALRAMTAKGFRSRPRYRLIMRTRSPSTGPSPTPREHRARSLQVSPVAVRGRARSLAGRSFYARANLARAVPRRARADSRNLPEARLNCDRRPPQGLWSSAMPTAGLLGALQSKARRPGTRSPSLVKSA